ncbi:MAG: hypothetical protein V4695_09775 [Pseudomonadota bacterium]
MPVINVVLNEIDHQRLEAEHEALKKAWAKLGHSTLPPTFAAWLGTRISQQTGGHEVDNPMGDVRLFNAIEKLITSLPIHGFQLAHTTATEVPTANSATASSTSLASAMVKDFKLQPHYTKRLQELFLHYLKTPKEIADAAHVGITNRAYGALTEAQRRLTARTSASIERLGADRAIGRIEGATAMLVSLDVMNTTTAKKHTSAFKIHARTLKKTGWVKKMFGEG